MKVNCISIITPCRNAEALIEATVESVLSQRAVAAGHVRLEYIVLDGASTDRTLEILGKLTHPCMRVISERDSGLYDALATGLQMAQGEVIAYLNAGDLFSPHAFEVVLDLFEQNNVRWLTGLNVLLNQQGVLLRSYLPCRYRRRLLACGFYGKVLAHVQQESTFWARELHAQIDFDRLRTFSLAGDFYLWHEFARVADLHIVEAHLGGFCIHPGQKSADQEAYLREMRTLARRIWPLDWCLGLWDGLLYYLNLTKLKKRINPKTLFVYEHSQGHWR